MDTNLYEIMRNAWPEWRIVEKIGKGQFATVYRAVRESGGIEEWAAIKAIMIPEREEIEELRTEGLTSSQIYSYFQGIVRDYTREIQLMNSVKGHPNVVHIEDYSILHSREEMRWIILIRMELLTPLTQWAAGRTITEQDVLKMGVDLCAALVACQEKNIVHRDIAPKNIFVDDEGRFKLGDFGVARTLEKTTNNFTKAGTPFYMAPEVYKGLAQTTDLRTAVKVDIYSLGLVLYWAANGERLPFVPLNKPVPTPEDRRSAFVRRMNGERIPEPKVWQGLAWVILRAIEYNVEDRYENAGEMLGDLRILMTGKVPSELKKYGYGHQHDQRQKRRWLIALIVILSVAAIGFGGWLLVKEWLGHEVYTPESMKTETSGSIIEWETEEPEGKTEHMNGGENVLIPTSNMVETEKVTPVPTVTLTMTVTPVPTSEPTYAREPMLTDIPVGEPEDQGTYLETAEPKKDEMGRSRLEEAYLEVNQRENPAPYSGATSQPIGGDNEDSSENNALPREFDNSID